MEKEKNKWMTMLHPSDVEYLSINGLRVMLERLMIFLDTEEIEKDWRSEYQTWLENNNQ